MGVAVPTMLSTIREKVAIASVSALDWQRFSLGTQKLSRVSAETATSIGQAVMICSVGG